MSGKAEILARIERALGDRSAPAAIPRDYHQADATTHPHLVTLFEERLRDYGAGVRRCAGHAIPETIAAALIARGAHRVLAPEGLQSDWVPGAVRDDPPLSNDELDGLDGVLTICAVGIAQTGTIVLDHGPGQGRRVATLLPDYHLVVIEVGQILHTVPDAVAALNPTRPMTWISGPSATSDIELERVEGVHGPRTLEVIIAMSALHG